MNLPNASYTREQLLELTRKVGEIATAEGPHDLALSALLGAYATIAIAHPCCYMECALQLSLLADVLAISAARHRAADIGASSPHLH